MYTMLMKDLSKDLLITTLSQNNLNLRVKTCHGFLVLLMHRHMSVSVQDMCKKKARHILLHPLQLARALFC